MNPTPPALAVAYLRVSSGVQATDGTSLDTQASTVARQAQMMGASLVESYTDTLSGARYWTRTGLQAALQRVEALRREHPERAVFLVVARWDRFARDLSVQETIEARLSACGALLISCDGTPTVHLIGDSVARVTIRATLSGIEIGADAAPRGTRAEDARG